MPAPEQPMSACALSISADAQNSSSQAGTHRQSTGMAHLTAREPFGIASLVISMPCALIRVCMSAHLSSLERASDRTSWRQKTRRRNYHDGLVAICEREAENFAGDLAMVSGLVDDFRSSIERDTADELLTAILTNAHADDVFAYCSAVAA